MKLALPLIFSFLYSATVQLSLTSHADEEYFLPLS